MCSDSIGRWGRWTGKSRAWEISNWDCGVVQSTVKRNGDEKCIGERWEYRE